MMISWIFPWGLCLFQIFHCRHSSVPNSQGIVWRSRKHAPPPPVWHLPEPTGGRSTQVRVGGWVRDWVGLGLGGWVKGWLGMGLVGWGGGWVRGWVGGRSTQVGVGGSGSGWVRGWVGGWGGEWVGGWGGGWVSEWAGEWVGGWVGESGNGWVSKWVSGWGNGRVTGVGGWVGEWGSGWGREEGRVSEWVGEGGRKGESEWGSGWGREEGREGGRREGEGVPIIFVVLLRCCSLLRYATVLRRCLNPGRFNRWTNHLLAFSLRRALQVGSSSPWPEVLRNLTGSDELSAEPLLEYFRPLQRWLERQNEGHDVTWQPECPDGSLVSSGSVRRRLHVFYAIFVIAALLVYNISAWGNQNHILRTHLLE